MSIWKPDSFKKVGTRSNCMYQWILNWAEVDTTSRSGVPNFWSMDWHQSAAGQKPVYANKQSSIWNHTPYGPWGKKFSMELVPGAPKVGAAALDDAKLSIILFLYLLISILGKQETVIYQDDTFILLSTQYCCLWNARQKSNFRNIR